MFYGEVEQGQVEMCKITMYNVLREAVANNSVDTLKRNSLFLRVLI